MKVVHLITIIGIIFTVLFHIFVKEPSHKEVWELKVIEEAAVSTANQEARIRTASNYSANLKERCSTPNGFANKPNLLDQRLDKTVSIMADTPIETSGQKTGNTVLKRQRNQRIWSDWLKSTNFWKICLIYMMSRLYVNVTQVYTPLYLQETLRLAKVKIH